jgi:hypothetical protein
MPEPDGSQRSRRRTDAAHRVNVAVALTEDAVGRIDEVAASCRALGFAHDWTLGGVGVLTGSAAVGDVPKLRAVPGVLAVEAEREPPSTGSFACLRWRPDRRRQ